jgi:hypothetical protein
MKWSVFITRTPSRWSRAHLRSTSGSRLSLSPISTLVGVVSQAASGRAPSVARVTGRRRWSRKCLRISAGKVVPSPSFNQYSLSGTNLPSVRTSMCGSASIQPRCSAGKPAGRGMSPYDHPTAATGGAQAVMASRTSAASSTSPAIGVRWEGKSGVITCTVRPPTGAAPSASRLDFPTDRGPVQHRHGTGRIREAPDDGTADDGNRSTARPAQLDSVASGRQLDLPPLDAGSLVHQALE